MVYECPQCKTPLPPGVMACAKCGLQFATAIPADATVPAAGLPPSQAAVTEGYAPFAPDSVPPRRAIAAVVALGVILVAAALFAIYTFSHTPASDTTASAPPAASALPLPSPSLPVGAYTRGSAPPVPTTNLAPVQLSGGSGSSSGGGAAASSDNAALQGRWQAKNLDFYVFNGDGTGSRGNTSNPAKADNFTWVVTGSQLVLNGKKEERMSFSTGPDATILYLHTPDGRYTQFAKQGAS